jgi:chemotaxis response regulator CheB
MAFVLIQHMDPSHKSVLTSLRLLQKATVMPVKEVTDGMTVEPNHIYVIPPNSLMTISKRVLALTPHVRAGQRVGQHSGILLTRISHTTHYQKPLCDAETYL